MKLKYEFFKLPLGFDVDKLTEEVLSLSDSDWMPHPDGFEGNSSVPLISLNGEKNNAFDGPMKTTKILQRLPYIQQVIASFGEVFGRSRLMRLSPDCEVPLHTDTSYHWANRVHIHIPIITDSEVIFHCEDKQVNMAAGETWIFDSWKNHKVQNNGKTNRVHLVIDTAGSGKFWNMVEHSAAPCEENVPARMAHQHIAYEINRQMPIMTENFNSPKVMSPGELDGLVTELKLEMRLAKTNAQNEVDAVDIMLSRFTKDWRQIWCMFGDSQDGLQHYHKLRDYMQGLSRQFSEELVASNGVCISQVLQYCILTPALNESL